jgi:hypothetical protein
MWDSNINMDFRKISFEDCRRIELAQDLGLCVGDAEPENLYL